MKNFAKANLILYLFLLLFAQPLSAQIKVGAEKYKEYLPQLKDKNVALVVNQTSLVEKVHLLDFLLSKNIKVKKVFAPEHGFRGDAEAGASIKDGKDKKTGIPIVSLYGNNKKPKPEDLADVDVVIFDIQDVGARFYTYISTMHYVMESCAENNKLFMVLDRPNPNGNYIDGPVLEKKFTSFVGMHPVPIVHGMTVGEYAQMINGEGWLANGLKCSLIVVKTDNYNHKLQYALPVPPSPNLRTMQAIYLYPSLCLFEGTDVSVGRGTEAPFEIIGKPGFEDGNFEFTPKAIKGQAENPPYKDQLCKGFKLTKFADEYMQQSRQIYLYWLTGFYQKSTDKEKFFNSFFDKLAGTDKLRLQIQQGMEPDKIRESWKQDLEAFRKVRAKYLLYPDFI